MVVGFDEVKPLLEMLALGKHYQTFHDAGLKTVDDVLKNPRIWKSILSTKRDRDLLEGYLELRRTKPAKEVEESERRLKLFEVVRTTLRQLRDLQLRKAEMERATLVQQMKSKSFQQPNGQHEDLLDQLDEARERLEAAQKELAALSANSETEKKRKPMSRPSTLRKATANVHVDPGSGKSSPRVSGEPSQSANTAPRSPSRPPSSKPHAYSSATPRFTANVTGQSLKAERPPQVPEPDSPGTATSPPVRKQAAFDPMDVGQGWNRPKPVSRTEFFSGIRTRTMLDRHQHRQAQAGSEESLMLTGVKANRFSLGINIEGDHYTQMRLGATSQRGTQRSASARPQDGSEPLGRHSARR